MKESAQLQELDHTKPENILLLYGNSLEAISAGVLNADHAKINLLQYIRELKRLNVEYLESKLLEPLNQYRDKLTEEFYDDLIHEIRNPI